MSNASPAYGFPIAFGNRVVKKGVGKVMGGHKGHPKQTRGTACDSRSHPQGCSQRALSTGDRRQACRARCLSCCIPREGAAVPSHSLGPLPWAALEDFLLHFLTLHLPQASPTTFPLHTSQPLLCAPTLSLPASLPARLPDATSAPTSLRPAAFLSILTACCRAS